MPPHVYSSLNADPQSRQSCWTLYCALFPHGLVFLPPDSNVCLWVGKVRLCPSDWESLMKKSSCLWFRFYQNVVTLNHLLLDRWGLGSSVVVVVRICLKIILSAHAWDLCLFVLSVSFFFIRTSMFSSTSVFWILSDPRKSQKSISSIRTQLQWQSMKTLSQWACLERPTVTSLSSKGNPFWS
jgi:hypothetical protein